MSKDMRQDPHLVQVASNWIAKRVNEGTPGTDYYYPRSVPVRYHVSLDEEFSDRMTVLAHIIFHGKRIFYTGGR